MMAVVADTIICSPWSVLGSIGVLSGMPNMSKRLEKEGLKFYKLTAGDNKNTLDPFTTPTEEGLEHVQSNMERILELFANHVDTNRKGLLTKDISDIATGDTWQGVDALELGLADVLQTSEQYVNSRMDGGALVYSIEQLTAKEKRGPLQQLLNQGHHEDGFAADFMGGGVGSGGGVGVPPFVDLEYSSPLLR